MQKITDLISKLLRLTFSDDYFKKQHAAYAEEQQVEHNQKLLFYCFSMVTVLLLVYSLVRFADFFGSGLQKLPQYQLNLRIFFVSAITISGSYMIYYLLLKDRYGFSTQLTVASIYLAALYIMFGSTALNAQLYHGDIAFAVIASYGIATLFTIGVRMALFLFLVLAAGVIGGISVLQVDLEVSRINSVNFLSHSIGAWLWSRYMFHYRTRHQVNLLTLGLSNEKMKKEMGLANAIQQQILPHEPPDFAPLRVTSHYRPVSEVGGDFYDYIFFEDGEKLGIFLCDVVGHGIPAALICSIIKNLLLSGRAEQQSPAHFLDHLNQQTCGLVGGNFFTAFYAVFDRSDMVLTYARGGHTPPRLLREGQVYRLDSPGHILGVFADSNFSQTQVQLQPGDRIVVYSDGFIEEQNPEGEYFEDTLNHEDWKAMISKYDFSANTLFSDLLEFKSSAEFKDDVTLITLAVRP